MRRADRLFQLVQILRNKRFATAQALAERLEVSVRTIYRDIQDLSLSGVPIEGEAGVGYHLRYSLDIPPLTFTADEIEALVVGARMVDTWGGTDLGQHARSALDKVEAVIPYELQNRIDGSPIYAPRFSPHTDIDGKLDQCRHAINTRRYLNIRYQRADGECSERRIKPLALFFWGEVWTLLGWCELRQDFRSFRVDRLQGLSPHDDTFPNTPGQELSDYAEHSCDSAELFFRGLKQFGA